MCTKNTNQLMNQKTHKSKCVVVNEHNIEFTCIKSSINRLYASRLNVKNKWKCTFATKNVVGLRTSRKDYALETIWFN